MEQVFIDNPQLDVVYKTADGKYFLLENDAQNYASTLENKKVSKLIRQDISPTNEEEKKELSEEIQEKQDINQQEDIIEEKSKKTENKDE